MYRKPTVVRFGTLRELTKIGFTGVSDGTTVMGNVTGTGCQINTGQPGNDPNSDLFCPRS